MCVFCMHYFNLHSLRNICLYYIKIFSPKSCLYCGETLLEVLLNKHFQTVFYCSAFNYFLYSMLISILSVDDVNFRRNVWILIRRLSRIHCFLPHRTVQHLSALNCTFKNRMSPSHYFHSTVTPLVSLELLPYSNSSHYTFWCQKLLYKPPFLHNKTGAVLEISRYGLY
jgi:hypothetical protein